MANHYFQFKEFTVQQQYCAMKVSTDACIQGAWTPVEHGVKSVLDIGCGTGLLSLMLAQRYATINITAIDIDASATMQAKENCLASPWNDRIQVVEGDARQYLFPEPFDMVICNPPFFQNSLQSQTKQRTIARHNTSLSLEKLFEIIATCLSPKGTASVLLPVKEHQQWKKILTHHGWGIVKSLQIIPREGGACNRVVSICSKSENGNEEGSLIIKNKTNDDYTLAFIQLMQSFYLHL